jgi:hypothetical protein
VREARLSDVLVILPLSSHARQVVISEDGGSTDNHYSKNDSDTKIFETHGMSGSRPVFIGGEEVG